MSDTRESIPADGKVFDVCIVGAGINGAGIARDAAGRGLKVLLCDQGDIGGATSSASSKLIHGGLRYLEHYAFGLVAESLGERETLLRIAPHLCRPVRFVTPYSAALRPAWMIRAGLLIYDGLARLRGPVSLPAARGIDLGSDPRGAPLKPEYRRGFEYSDLATDDARLTLINAMDAAQRGADVRPRTRLVGAQRGDGHWLATLEREGQRVDIEARILINAAGPWVAKVLDTLPTTVPRHAVRLVRGSHIVVPRRYEGEQAYTLQNDDGRVCFLIPWQRHTLIGTTEVASGELDSSPQASPDEIDYLCRAASRYLRRAVTPADVVWHYAGVRPLVDDGHSNSSAVSREYRLTVDVAPDGDQPLLTVIGGKLTTYRTLAEAALKKLSPWLPGLPGPWTDGQALPGGELGGRTWPAFVSDLQRQFPALPPEWLGELAGRHGSLCAPLLEGVRDLAGLGRHFGGGLYEREIDYCRRHEWAQAVEDLVWRRSKAGIAMSSEQIQALADYLGSGRTGD